MIEDIEIPEAPEIEGGQKLCSYCAKPFTPKHGMQKYHPACKKKKEKERKRTGSGSKSRTSSTTRGMWLVRKEAEIIGYILQFVFARKTGLKLQPPGEKPREHLAHVLKALEKQPPFSYIQRFLYRIFPVVDPDSKPGATPLGDTAHYLWGWYESNPELQDQLGAMVPPIFSPDGAGAQQSPEYVEGISYQEYMARQGAQRVDPMASHRMEETDHGAG